MGRKKSLNRAELVQRGIPLIFFPGLVLASILGWNWVRGLELLDKSGGYKNNEIVFPEKAKVTKVLDGDSFEIGNGQTVRMVSIDAPNRGEKGYEEAAEYLALLIDGEEVEIEYDTYQEDKFGRLLGYVFEKCSRSIGCQSGRRLVNWVMIKKGYAKFVRYEDRRKLKYDALLEAAGK